MYHPGITSFFVEITSKKFLMVLYPVWHVIPIEAYLHKFLLPNHSMTNMQKKIKVRKKS